MDIIGVVGTLSASLLAVVGIVSLVVLGAFVYLLPTFIAYARDNYVPKPRVLLWLNVLLGLTGIFWVITLVWASWNWEETGSNA
jgi:hypothetical protein